MMARAKCAEHPTSPARKLVVCHPPYANNTGASSPRRKLRMKRGKSGFVGQRSPMDLRTAAFSERNHFENRDRADRTCGHERLHPAAGAPLRQLIAVSNANASPRLTNR